MPCITVTRSRSAIPTMIFTARARCTRSRRRWRDRPSPPGIGIPLEITLKGQEIIVSLNGGEVNHFDPNDKAQIPERTKEYEPERGPRPTSGYIGLQNHGEVTNNAYVHFKEVSVRPLTNEDRPKSK